MIKDCIRNIFNTKVDAVGLSIFRMCYALLLFFEVAQLYKFRKVIYDDIPFISKGEINVIYIFALWAVVLLFLFLGLFTRMTTLLNYVLGIIIFSSASDFEYHVFYTYVGVNFVLIFMPISRVLSLDALVSKIKYTNVGASFSIDRKVLEINYLIPVYLGIALIYFDSIFLKLNTKLWTNGLGVWLPASLPMMTWNDTSLVLNQKELVIFLSYFVLVFEALFIFLFWFKKLRIPLIIIGVFFHVGILITYPIPFFALAFILIYLLLIPVSFWQRITQLLKFSKTRYTFYYDAACPLCVKIVAAVQHLDVFQTISCKSVQGNYQNEPALQPFSEQDLFVNIHGVTTKGKVYIGYWAYVQLFKSLIYLFPVGILLQIPSVSHIGRQVYKYVSGNRLTERCTAENCSLPVYVTPIAEDQDLFLKGWNRLAITKKFWKFFILFLFFIQCLLITRLLPQGIASTFKNAFGVARHAVFVDDHFRNYNHTFKIVYVDKHGKRSTIPIIDDHGMPGAYVSGIIWRNISFNVVTSQINTANFEKGIVPYLRFYLEDYNIDANETAHFEFYFKTIDTPTHWEKDFLHKQMAKPWTKAGDCQLTKEQHFFKWNVQMQALTEKEAK